MHYALLDRPLAAELKLLERYPYVLRKHPRDDGGYNYWIEDSRINKTERGFDLEKLHCLGKVIPDVYPTYKNSGWWLIRGPLAFLAQYQIEQFGREGINVCIPSRTLHLSAYDKQFSFAEACRVGIYLDHEHVKMHELEEEQIEKYWGSEWVHPWEDYLEERRRRKGADKAEQR